MQHHIRHITLLIFFMMLPTHLVVAATHYTNLPTPQSEQCTISVPRDAILVLEQTEINSPSAPISVISRSRRTISQLTNPTPMTYAQYVFYCSDIYAQTYWHCGRRIIINLPSEQIPYPFHSFW